MLSIALLNQAGETLKTVELNEEVFGIEPNQQVIYDVVNAQRAAMRQGTHDTLNRTEVRGGGKKPWSQKGTGRARQGSIRAPQWRGGGTVFGPTPRSYAVKVNKKVRQLGLKSALSYKVKENKLTLIEFLKNIKVEGKVMVIVSELTEEVVLSARNLPNVFVSPADHASVFDILCYDKLVMTESAAKYFEEVLA